MINTLKKWFGRKSEKKRNLDVSFHENQPFQLEIRKEPEKPSEFIKAIQGRQVVYDLVPKVDHALRNSGLCHQFQGYIQDNFRAYQTEQGIIHGITFANEESLTQFKQGLELLGYKTNGQNTANIECVQIYLHIYKESPSLINGQEVKKTANSFYELYSFGLPVLTNPARNINPISKLEEMALEDIEKAKTHARRLINPGSDIFFTKQCQKEGYVSENDTPLVAVHATNYLPKKGQIHPGGPALEIAGRRTIHFSLNGIATAGAISSSDAWKNKQYYIVVPVADLLEHNKPFGGVASDFFFPGPVQLPDTTQVFSSREEAEKYIQTISRLRDIGKREWTDYDIIYDRRDFSLCRVLNIHTEAHDCHWTSDYEKYRESKIPHNEAIAKILTNRIQGYYPEQEEDPTFEKKQVPFLRHPVKVFHSGKMSQIQARKKLGNEMNLIGFNLPEFAEN